MRVSDFDFTLPEELIAQHPPAERGSSRMLVIEGGTGPPLDAHFRQLPDFLRPGDLLVLNDSRVIPARLFARRAANPPSQNRDAGHPTTTEPSGTIEVLLTERVADESTPLPKQSLGGASNVWRALVKPGRKVRAGDRLEFFADETRGSAPLLTAQVISAGERGERALRFDPVPDFNAMLARIGHMPLPPYIRRNRKIGPDAPEDRERYQTVYARNLAPDEPGSAAAPTAGLHFTPRMLDALRASGVHIAYLTLHVGLGTFQPVRVGQVEDIKLHSEHYTLPAATAEALRRALHDRRRIVAVGTTTTRTLEHIAREAGADTLSSSILPRHRPDAAFNSRWIERIAPHSGSTSIFIAPGHRFRIVSGLLTNFHLPSSTLLMLVSAFAADRMAHDQLAVGGESNAGDIDLGRHAVLAAYRHAVEKQYRFYSYGDCMVIV